MIEILIEIFEDIFGDEDLTILVMEFYDVGSMINLIKNIKNDIYYDKLIKQNKLIAKNIDKQRMIDLSKYEKPRVNNVPPTIKRIIKTTRMRTLTFI